MNDYAIMTSIVATCVAVLFAAFYARFRAGLTTRLVGVFTVPAGICVLIGFWLGKEGITADRVAIAAPLGTFVVAISILYVRATILIPIATLATHMTNAVDQKNLSRRMVQSPRQDEIGDIQRAYITLADDMRRFIDALQSGIGRLSSSSTDLATVAQQSVSIASEQAAVASQLSATVEELSRTSRSTAESAEEVVKVSEQALDTDRKVLTAMKDATRRMDNITDRARGATECIRDLDSKNTQISEIIDSVTAVAGQSNLLAVNASIEASRAGEHGRGFSVVANEVKSLADQSKEAAKLIQGIIATIRRSSDDAVDATIQSEEEAGSGKKAVGDVSSSMHELSEVLEDSSSKARLIFGASSQQAAGIQQITSAIMQVKQGGDDITQAATQTEAAVQELTALGTHLNEIAEQYDV